MDFGITGKRALVCAASKGLGKAAALALVKEGVQVFVCARNPETLTQTVNELQALSPYPVLQQTADLADPHQQQALIHTVNQAWGGLDILIHNTGGPPPTAAHATEIDQWQQGFQQLFLSTIALNQAFLPHMTQNRWGRIVYITSIAAVEPVHNLAISNALRAGILGLAKTLATEVAKDNITVNCLAPGFILTDGVERLVQHQLQTQGGNRDTILDTYAQAIPAGRLGYADEIGSAIAFLCSNPASYITGTVLSVDGGLRKTLG